jgi:predicted dehydrogenase
LHAFGDEQSLITHPDVDLVVILAPAPEHARFAKAAIAAGKDVYSEWPLTTKTSDSEELLALAEARGFGISSAYSAVLRRALAIREIW